MKREKSDGEAFSSQSFILWKSEGKGQILEIPR